MVHSLLLISAVLLLCVASSKMLYRYGVPTLLIFLVLGMLFGSDGPGGIYFDDYELARQICSIGLIFIIFYGGFGTSWKHARPVAAPAVWMASLGVVLTAGLTGLFSAWLLKCSLLEGMLIGSVVASTDAASVFAILRSRNLNLKGGLASLLEVESGSNDPTAYMLTIIVLNLLSKGQQENMAVLVLLQVGVGLGLGAGLALGTRAILQRVELEIEGLYYILMVAVALLGYALSEYFGGNGYLCVYLSGIILGNSKIPRKRPLVPFFDGLSWIMQIMLFFTLGLLAFPSRLPEVIVPGALLFLFMLVVARPVATFAILSWFRMPVRQQLLVSWVGLRGAASIVFAIYAVTYHPGLEHDMFHLVFIVCLLSIVIQGTLIPQVARRLGLVETGESVLKTFTDYEEELPSDLVELKVEPCSPLAGKCLRDAVFPSGTLVVMLKRGSNVLIPNGETQLRAGDRLVLSTQDRDALEGEAEKNRC